MNSKPERHLLIFTCTVNPYDKAIIVRSNPEERLNDYIASINRAIEKTKDLDIEFLVAENSGSINLLKSGIIQEGIKINSLTFIPCKYDSLSSRSGISAGEHKILEEVVSLIDLSRYDVIWKLTGRLFIENLSSLIKSSHGQLRVNRFFTQNHTIDSRFFGASTEVFKQFALSEVSYAERSEPKIESGNISTFKSIEFYLTFFSMHLESLGLCVRGLPHIPVYKGISASTGKKLDSFTTRLKIKLCNLFRPLFIKGLLGVSP